MLIDWFTVGAQVINFLVLVVVLKVVLFDRVVAAMDRREAAIAARIGEAEDREAEAATEAQDYRARRRQLEEERDLRLQEADAEAARRRTELVDQARAHVDELREGWEGALAQERTRFLEEIRRRTGEQACTVSRRALSDLADADLEAQVVRTALRRLEDSDGLAPLEQERGDGTIPITVACSFGFSDDLASQVVKAVADTLGGDVGDVELCDDPDLVCGLEIRVGGWSVSWSIDSYLDAVVEDFEALLPEGRAGL